MAREPEKTTNDKDEPNNETKVGTKEGTKDKTVEEATQSEPYPTGNPPDPEDQFQAAHGFRREKAKEEKK